MYSGLRTVLSGVFTPLAKILMRLGVSPDVVTVAGTVITMTLALWLIPTGHLFLGGLLVGVFCLFDSLDGVLARLSGKTSQFGAFLDSTMDRFADGAVFVSLTLYFTIGEHRLLPRTIFGIGQSLTSSWESTWAAIAAISCLVVGGVVSYARAKAESLGAKAHVGIFERWLRLVGALVPVGFIQLGLPTWVAALAITLVAVGSAWTVLDRIMAVRQQLGTSTSPGTLTPADQALAPAGPRPEQGQGQ